LFEKRAIPTGLQHGTVTVLSGDERVEVTTYRTDGSYADHRHPERVTFTRSLTEDLARRDFTVNAMAWHPKRGLCDPFGGAADLKAGIIRAVGDPKLRFEEDALRILRGIRFAVRLGFAVEAHTAQAMNEAAPTLRYVAKERITEELRGILALPDCARIWDGFWSVWEQVLPDIKPISAQVLSVPLDFVLRLTLIGYLSKADVTRDLCLTKVEKKAIARLTAALDRTIPTDRIGVKRLAAEVGVEDADALLRLWAAIGADTEGLGEMLCECVEAGECLSVGQLAVSGADLGLPPAQIGVALRELLDAVVSERVANQREALLFYLKNDILVKKGRNKK
jgi:tRNA nucleotidyltransferase (CCA-adding enzyme)